MKPHTGFALEVLTNPTLLDAIVDDDRSVRLALAQLNKVMCRTMAPYIYEKYRIPVVRDKARLKGTAVQGLDAKRNKGKGGVEESTRKRELLSHARCIVTSPHKSWSCIIDRYELVDFPNLKVWRQEGYDQHLCSLPKEVVLDNYIYYASTYPDFVRHFLRGPASQISRIRCLEITVVIDIDEWYGGRTDYVTTPRLGLQPVECERVTLVVLPKRRRQGRTRIEIETEAATTCDYQRGVVKHMTACHLRTCITAILVGWTTLVEIVGTAASQDRDDLTGGLDRYCPCPAGEDAIHERFRKVLNLDTWARIDAYKSQNAAGTGGNIGLRLRDRVAFTGLMGYLKSSRSIDTFSVSERAWLTDYVDSTYHPAQRA